MTRINPAHPSEETHSPFEIFNAPEDFTLSGITLTKTQYLGKDCLCMTMPENAIQDPTKEKLADRDYMSWIPLDFTDGVIEAWVASELIPNAPAYARGFIGVTFRIDRTGRFESIYLRPTNSVCEEQVRRNHSVQYISFPDYRFDRLRAESPEKYESYGEIDLHRWIHMKLVVKGTYAALYLDNKPQPALIVNDLKLGDTQSGGVGIWLESGTIAYFRDLKIGAR